MSTLYSVRTGLVALSANATHSCWLLNPATDGIKLTRVGFSVDASASAPGIGLELYRTTTLGSPAGTTATIVKYSDPNAASASMTALTALTTEPTAVEVLEEWTVQPFGGLLVIDNPLGREAMAAAAGARLGLRYVNPTGGSTANYRAYAITEEQ